METQSLPILDSSRRQWRSCLLCGLIKTRQQFIRDGCDNCDDILQLQGSQQTVADCTTAEFQGIVAAAQPGSSVSDRE
jgi:transcription elongation factor SPT4